MSVCRNCSVECSGISRLCADCAVLWRWCPSCESVKLNDEFYRNRSRSSGFESRCKVCSGEKSKRWYATNREAKRWRTRERLYGLTREDHLNLLVEQGGCCAICGERPAVGQELHVDHCHVGGQVRGLLCSQCNTGIGLFKDNPAVMELAASYVRSRTA